jgi:hypothetical protein
LKCAKAALVPSSVGAFCSAALAFFFIHCFTVLQAAGAARPLEAVQGSVGAPTQQAVSTSSAQQHLQQQQLLLYTAIAISEHELSAAAAAAAAAPTAEIWRQHIVRHMCGLAMSPVLSCK